MSPNQSDELFAFFRAESRRLSHLEGKPVDAFGFPDVPPGTIRMEKPVVQFDRDQIEILYRFMFLPDFDPIYMGM